MKYDDVIEIVQRKARYMGGGIYMIEHDSLSITARGPLCLVEKLYKAIGGNDEH